MVTNMADAHVGGRLAGLSVLITGAPASGKTTLRRSLETRFPGTRSLGIDDVIREMISTGEFTHTDAYIDNDGAAILIEPESASFVASSRLVDKWAALGSDVFIEAPIIDTMLDKLRQDRILSRRTVVVELHAPLSVRIARNDRRKRDRIGSLGMSLMPDHMNPQIEDLLESAVMAHYRVNGNQPREATLLQVLGALAEQGVAIPKRKHVGN